MDWKFKKNAKKQGSSDGFWYGLTDGGYINPEEVLADQSQLKQLQDAVSLVKDFERAMEDAELIEEF